MKAALVGAIECNTDHLTATPFDLIVAVDAGWQTCMNAGIVPHTAIGDFDSLGFVPDALEVCKYSSVKDESDMELALRYAKEKGATCVFLYGAFGMRLDHTLANIQVMSEFARGGLHVCGIGADYAVVMLASGPGVSSSSATSLEFQMFDPKQLHGSYAPYISVLNPFGEVSGLSIHGLAYEVSDFTLPAGSSRGLSNEFVGAPVSIHLGAGCVIVVFPLDALAFATTK